VGARGCGEGRGAGKVPVAQHQDATAVADRARPSAKLRLAVAAMGKPETNVGSLCAELGVTRSTLYRHVSPTGEPRANAAPIINDRRL
jgi:DNA-binding phage protein